MDRVTRLAIWTVVLLALGGNAFAQGAFGCEDDDGRGRVTVEPVHILAEPGESTIVTVSYIIPHERYQERCSKFLGFALDTTGLTLGEIEYPPGRFLNGRYVYEKRVTLSAPLTVADSTPPGLYDIVLNVGYQFCDEAGFCFTPHQESHAILVEVVYPSDESRTDSLHRHTSEP